MFPRLLTVLDRSRDNNKKFFSYSSCLETTTFYEPHPAGVLAYDISQMSIVLVSGGEFFSAYQSNQVLRVS